MSPPGYQCQKCWATFLGCSHGGDSPESELKCPTCQSTDVDRVELPDDWVFQGPGGLCFG